MTHDDIVTVLEANYAPDPAGLGTWSYQGDGSSFDPIYSDAGVMVSRGLEWHRTDPRPTLADIEAALPAAQAKAALATGADHAAASAALVTQQLAAVPIERAALAAILATLLGEASSAIPFFEQYALDPSMTAQQWTDFQALDQAVLLRLQYDCIRTLAAVLRYLTGDLPTS